MVRQVKTREISVVEMVDAGSCLSLIFGGSYIAYDYGC
jgi:hypothetical protein